MLKSFKKYLLVWFRVTFLAVQSSLENRLAAGFFLFGKFIRFFFFLFFLYIIDRQVNSIGGYSLTQMVIFFLVFNLFDLIGQIFFRGIYWFREQVVSGEFDFRLIKPMSPLFQALTRETDILDVPLLLLVVIFLLRQPIQPSLTNVGLFLVLLVSGLLILTAVHITVAALGVITTEVDHTIMIYRDLSAMARFPVDIYINSIRALLTFVIPIAVAYTFPAKALLGLLTLQTALFSLLGAGVVLMLSQRLWSYALTQYSSASS